MLVARHEDDDIYINDKTVLSLSTQKIQSTIQIQPKEINLQFMQKVLEKAWNNFCYHRANHEIVRLIGLSSLGKTASLWETQLCIQVFVMCQQGRLRLITPYVLQNLGKAWVMKRVLHSCHLKILTFSIDLLNFLSLFWYIYSYLGCFLFWDLSGSGFPFCHPFRHSVQS